jgi:hypothetical protein
MRELAAELVRLKVDVIVTAGPASTRPAKEATVTIPIVMAFDVDPVGSGFERGKLADLIVLNRDYLTVPEKDIGGIKVLLTLVGGKIVHQNEQF